jgi:hypothetical protein
VEGLACCVVRRTAADGRTFSAWYASGLGALIRLERRAPEEDYDYRLLDIRLGEPPWSLFVVKEAGP